MKLWITAALIALINVSTYPAMAHHVTGEELLEYCESKNAAEWGFCSGFIWGAADGHQLTSNESASFCSPEDAASDHMGRVVVKYLREHPEKHHEYAAILVVVALIEAWPCVGGSLDLQSEVDVGTTVTVRFPAERIVSKKANVSMATPNEAGTK